MAERKKKRLNLLHPKKILLLGSGGLRIGQAGEFDYSGSQAIKAFKEAGIQVVLVNPNIATVQTDPNVADQVYLEPLNLTSVAAIIEKEKPDAIALSFGGQTALNLGLTLESKGILKKHNVSVLGTSVDAIRATEDRELFKQALHQLSIKTPASISAHSVKEALIAAEKIGYPVMLRAGFSLGGLGSGKVSNATMLREQAQAALSGSPQILIEEYLSGWKEFEYEIIRDSFGNALTICNMENLDPMGIHTGESIVVAPAQTLSDQEHQQLRDRALAIAAHFGIVGECNVQYAVNPQNGDYRVIELNARLSRSSALASKATGYPLAFVAAKLALGYGLHEIPNNVTRKTCAYFEPALDYIVVKIPRWDTHKLRSADRQIGSEMKSVGEVMGIGRTFPEALQKAVRMLNIGALGVEHYPFDIPKIEDEIHHATDRRLFALARFFAAGGTPEQAHTLSQIDLWFLRQIATINTYVQNLRTQKLTPSLLRQVKCMGISDQSIAICTHKTPLAIRRLRLRHGITPVVRQMDTTAGECAAATNYLYLTYHGVVSDISTSRKRPYMIIGSGPYSIGSSVEFDWCAVNTARALRHYGKPVILVNSNPETVSTDYDESDRLYFEQLTFETIQDIADIEQPCGIIISVGGQVANNLALPLHKAGYPLLGTSSEAIDMAENREKFSSLLHRLNIDQPAWTTATDLSAAKAFADKVGYPVLLRPSYILSGAAMNVVHDAEALEQYLKQASLVSPEHPVVVSKFINDAKELEVDGIAQNGHIVIDAISEHIENAGVHSGDATVVLPPQKLYLETIRKTKAITREIVAALNLTGPFNIQFIAQQNQIKVIECNVRASRSFPFVSKVTGHNLIEIMTAVFLNRYRPERYETLELDYVGVKTPQFSYHRLKGADPVAHVEMASTGEVACLGDDLLQAFYRSWQATEQSISGKKILLSVAEDKKPKLLEAVRELSEAGWTFYATAGTQQYLAAQGIESELLYKASQKRTPNLTSVIADRGVDLIINIPGGLPTDRVRSDGFMIRRLAIDHHVPLITNLQIAHIMLQSLRDLWGKPQSVKSLADYLHRKDKLV